MGWCVQSPQQQGQGSNPSLDASVKLLTFSSPQLGWQWYLPCRIRWAPKKGLEWCLAEDANPQCLWLKMTGPSTASCRPFITASTCLRATASVFFTVFYFPSPGFKYMSELFWSCSSLWASANMVSHIHHSHNPAIIATHGSERSLSSDCTPSTTAHKLQALDGRCRVVCSYLQCFILHLCFIVYHTSLIFSKLFHCPWIQFPSLKNRGGGKPIPVSLNTVHIESLHKNKALTLGPAMSKS